MPSLLDLGLTAGKALPAPVTPAATAGMVLGANGLWQYPPGYLLASDMVGSPGAAITTTDASILAAAFATGFPAGAAVHDMVDIEWAGTWVPGATQMFTMSLYMAGVVIASMPTSATIAASAARNFAGRLRIVYTAIGASGTVRVAGYAMPASSTGSGFQPPALIGDITFPDAANSAAVATNAAGIMDLKAKVSTSTATATLNWFQARYFPKNY